MPNGYLGIDFDLGKPRQGYSRPHNVAEIWDFSPYPFWFPFFVKKENLIMGTSKDKNFSS